MLSLTFAAALIIPSSRQNLPFSYFFSFLFCFKYARENKIEVSLSLEEVSWSFMQIWLKPVGKP